MNFKDIDNRYRPLPFWSWNERLNPEETREQVSAMHQAGLGGFFMHARGGLETEYMGREWFENVTAAIESAEQYHMRPWAYDENGWPSGFGNGVVNGGGEACQQKYLRMETKPSHPATQLGQCGTHWFYYEVNPYYVDTLDANVVKMFIDTVYQPYYEQYGNRLEGFFTDEPQISRNGIPWSFVFEEEYEKRYHESIFKHLESLFLPIGDYKTVRIQFWKMVTELFSQAFVKQIYEWCSARGLKLTGHLSQEDHLAIQVTANGACMPHYEFFHIPGIDWLGKKLTSVLPALQLASAAAQLDKTRVMTESFALCGHGISLLKLKGIFEWQAVRGVNLLCQHLEGYSIRGIRKRDYPPAMYRQQPWWTSYRYLMDIISRECMLLQNSRESERVLLLHPQTTVWSLYDEEKNEGIDVVERRLVETIEELERKHIPFHLGDETILERHARVESGRLIVGAQSYDKVITACCDIVLPRTQALLKRFEEQGGVIVVPSVLEANPIISAPEITYTVRDYENRRLHFFVNSTEETVTADIHIAGDVIDLVTGEIRPFSGFHTFYPWGSLMVLETDTKAIQKDCASETVVSLPETLTLCDCSENSLTLDRCDYYFDGVLEEENGYVLNICERANRLKRPVHIHQRYHFRIAKLPKSLYLACETPQKFQIAVNGHAVCGDDFGHGFFVDASFQKIDIRRYVREGENEISFDCDFQQSEAFYHNLEKAYRFESEKNKLVYDFEIEAVYLVGAFAVTTEGKWWSEPHDRMRYDGSFEIDALPQAVRRNELERQGFPFFCGQMTLACEVNIEGKHPILGLEPKGVSVLKLEMNGREETFLGAPFSLERFQAVGRTLLKVTLVNNLRNLLGPHHLQNEDVGLGIGPYSFYQEPCVWNEQPEADWHDAYCFETMGL